MGLTAACTSGGTGSGTAGNAELNLDIVNPGGISGELGFTVDRVDYRIACAGAGYILPPYIDAPPGPGGPCSTADLDGNGIPDVCPPGSNYIQGTAASENILGTTGPDCIFGFGGNDVIDGGNAADYICGGRGDDDIAGGNGRNELFGGSGNYIITGGNGNDLLDGRDGDDTLDGANSDDSLIGGPGIDTRVPPVWQAVMDLPPGDCTVTLSVWDTPQQGSRPRQSVS